MYYMFDIGFELFFISLNLGYKLVVSLISFFVCKYCFNWIIMGIIRKLL